MIIEIPGTPQQQGSKTQVRTRSGNTVMLEANRNLKPWRSLAITALRDMWSADPIMGPVFVWARFYFTRPLAHYGTGRNAGQVKSSAPVWFTSPPDTDKLQRALGDALTQSGVIHDDRQIVGWDARKAYANRPHTAVAVVRPGTHDWSRYFGGQ